MGDVLSFQAILERLADEKRSLPVSFLHRFSDLEPEQVKQFQQVWLKIPRERKREFLENLADLAESDTLLSFEDLALSLVGDPDGHVRTLSIRLLQDSEDRKLIPVLEDILQNDAEAEPRATAATGLGRFIYLGEIEEIPERSLHEVEEHLLVAAQSAKEVLVRRRALEALGSSSRPEVPPMIDKAYKSKEADWKISALYAMGVSSDDRWDKQVLANLTNQDEAIRYEAILAAGRIPLKSARSILLDLLADEEDADILQAITWALSEIGGEGVREQLEEMLETATDEEQEEFLEEALENLDFTEGISLFGRLDADEDSNEGE